MPCSRISGLMPSGVLHKVRLKAQMRPANAVEGFTQPNW